MYVRPISARLRAGRSTPAMRAIGFPLLPLPLLVLGVGADHPHHALAVDDLALVTNLFNRRPDFHRSALPDNSNRSTLQHSHDPAASGILGGQLHQNDIPQTQPDKVLSSRPGRVGDDLSPASFHFQPVG